MKIISGKYKGRIIEGFNLDGTRPTMERVKESLFAMIQNYLDNSTVLDLFSGSGNLGIEALSEGIRAIEKIALSEGASFAYFVDSNIKATKTIKNNVQNIGITNCEILNMDYQKALNYLHSKKQQVDIIFLDPPYKTNYIEKSINLIETLDLLAKGGLIICESDTLDRIVYSPNYEIIKDKKYGDKWVVILKKI